MLLVSSQMEMRNMLLATGGKGIHVIKWQKEWLNHVLLDRKLELVSDELEYLLEIPKQNVEYRVCFPASQSEM